jgi:serine/threonine protein kinase
MSQYPRTLDMMPKPLPVSRVLVIIEQMSRALSVLHAKHLVHLDVKPRNIFVDNNGDCYLGDFGSVLKIGDSTQQIRTTQAFLPIGFNPINHPIHDWWMLALVVVDLTAATDSEQVGMGSKSFSKQQVKTTLDELLQQAGQPESTASTAAPESAELAQSTLSTPPSLNSQTALNHLITMLGK